MYTNTWNKYFPVIRILVKRSVDAEQVLDLNSIDFERAGKGHKIGKFNIEFIDGKVTGMIRNNELAQKLASLLLEDDVTKLLLLQNDYEFSFDTKFKLYIKNIKKQPAQPHEEINVQENLLTGLSEPTMEVSDTSR